MRRPLILAAALLISILASACDGGGSEGGDDGPDQCEMVRECIVDQCSATCAEVGEHANTMPDNPDLSMCPAPGEPGRDECVAEAQQAFDDAVAAWEAERDAIYAEIESCGSGCGYASDRLAICDQTTSEPSVDLCA